jgi:hypothetical protein
MQAANVSHINLDQGPTFIGTPSRPCIVEVLATRFEHKLYQHHLRDAHLAIALACIHPWHVYLSVQM